MSILKHKVFLGLVTISAAGLISACTQTVAPPATNDESSEAIENTDGSEASDEKSDEKSEEVSKDKESSKGEVSSKDDDSKDDSSSKDDGEGSDASEGTSSSSEEPSSSDSSSDTPVKGEDTIITEVDNGNTNVNVGTNDMDEVSKDEAEKLDDLIKGDDLPDGVEKIEGSINGGDIDVGKNDYYCYTGDGWLKINFDNLKETGLPFLWNGAAWGLRSKYEMFFDDACEAVYAVRK